MKISDDPPVQSEEDEAVNIVGEKNRDGGEEDDWEKGQGEGDMLPQEKQQDDEKGGEVVDKKQVEEHGEQGPVQEAVKRTKDVDVQTRVQLRTVATQTEPPQNHGGDYFVTS